MSEYIPKFKKNNSNTIILSDLFDAERCMEYAKEHNMNVVMVNTKSTCLVEVMMLFQKNGFNHRLFEVEDYAPDGIKLSNKIYCLFEKSKVQEIVDEI